MARDEDLYTGMHSGSRRTRKEVTNEEKVTKQAVLLPVEKLLMEEIEKAKSEIPVKLMELVRGDSDETEVRSTLMAFRLYDQHLTELRNRFTTILRAKPRKVKDE